MPLISCEISRIPTWSADCVFFPAIGATQFAITDTKLYVLVAILSTQDTAKLFQQMKSGFKRTINWNDYQCKVTIQAQN